jgi:hypothetical protein
MDELMAQLSPSVSKLNLFNLPRLIPKLIIGSTGPFSRDHAWAYRVFRITGSTKERALGWQ